MTEKKMFQRLKKCSEQPFTMISNDIVKRPDMSRKAKGIMLYLLSLPDDWKINKEDIVNRSSDGDFSVRAGIAELEELGYLFREVIRDNGRIIGHQRNVFEQPVFSEGEPVDDDFQEEPIDGGNARGGFPTPGETPPTNTDITNTDITNTDITKIYTPYGVYTEQAPKQAPPGKVIITPKIPTPATVPIQTVVYGKKDINELIERLKILCEKNKVLYDKKDERNFGKHIMTAKDFGDFAEKMNISRFELAEKIMIESKKLKFRRGFCTGPKSIYQNYVEVYNLRVKSEEKKPISSKVVL